MESLGGRRHGSRIGRHRTQRNAWRSAWACRRRSFTLDLEPSQVYKAAPGDRRRTVRRGSSVLLFSSRVEASRAVALGDRRLAWRRSALALTRLAAHGEPAFAHWLRPRDFRRGISSLPIRGTVAGVSRFL